MSPLAVAHPFIDHQEKGERSAKEAEIVCEPCEAGRAVFAGDIEGFIHHLTHTPTAGFIGFPQIFRVNRPIRLLAAWISSEDGGGHGDDVVLGLSGHGDGAPGLDIATGGRPLRLGQPFPDFGLGKCIRQEGPG